MTNFDDVGVFHKLAGHPVNNSRNAEMPPLKTVRFREDFKIEELAEGIEALGDSESIRIQETLYYLKKAKACWNRIEESDLDPDLVKYADSVGDLIYVSHGAAHCYNFNASDVFDEVHYKNMTRFPENMDEVELTITKAESEGVSVGVNEIRDSNRYVVKRIDNDKVYKSAMHLLPDLHPILFPNK